MNIINLLLKTKLFSYFQSLQFTFNGRLFLTVNTTRWLTCAILYKIKVFQNKLPCETLKWTRVINNAMFFSKIIKKNNAFFTKKKRCLLSDK